MRAGRCVTRPSTQRRSRRTLRLSPAHWRAAAWRPADVRQVTDVLARAPRAVTDLPDELAEADDGEGPLAHAFWMFVSDLFAGFTPVLPFALLPMHSARVVSLLVTTVLLVALGVGRGLVAKRSVARATLETLVVAAAAAAAGVARRPRKRPFAIRWRSARWR